jgi:hypothetical protein
MQPNEINKDKLPKATPDAQVTREGGDDALSNLRSNEDTEDMSVPNEEAGLSTEERVVDDADNLNEPAGDDENAGSGIPSKE